MKASPTLNPALLEQLRPYLQTVARLELDPRLQRLIEPEDVVQQTLLVALEKGGQYRGQSEAELKGWLRMILLHTLRNELRKLHAKNRDVGRECSLDAVLEQSSAHLTAQLAAEQSSPSQRAVRNEQFEQLATALADLPPAQRAVVQLHHLQRRTLEEIARHLGRTPAAVAGLLKRGLATLRERMRLQE